MAKGPVFLEKRSYRQRRMVDAIRLLPFLGLLLWMIPLGWPVPSDPTGQEGIPMSLALKYIFGVWVLLVVLGALLWRRTAGRMGAERGGSGD